MTKLTVAILLAIVVEQVVGRFKAQLESVFSWLPQLLGFIVASAAAFICGIDWLWPILDEVGFVPMLPYATLVISSLVVGAGPEALKSVLNSYQEREQLRRQNGS